MHLRTVELRHWRSYRHAVFEFPPPDGNRNVILVRAPNEAGKTSFFEAVILGLFGRDGLPLLPRARNTAVDSRADRPLVSYSKFLEGALHRRLSGHSKPSCAVTLVFEGDNGERIELVRTWYFSAKGDHRPNEDQLQIYEGREREPLIVPVAATADSDGWHRQFVARNFLPPHLAEFFMFDGEQVQRYAHRDMTAQIRRGIEGLLGLPILYELQKSLGRYATARRANSVAPSDQKMTAIKEDIERLDAEQEKQQHIIDDASTILDGLESERDKLAQRLGSGGEGTMAEVADLVKQEERYRTASSKAFDELMKLLSGDIALTLCGAELRTATVERLRAEKAREDWEMARNQGNDRLDRYLTDFSTRLGILSPPVVGERELEIVDAARSAWQALWHPAPEGCPDYYLHSGLKGLSREHALERLDSAAGRTATELRELVGRFQSSASRADIVKGERLNLEAVIPEIEPLTNRLIEVSDEINRVRERRNTATRAREAAVGELAKLRQDQGRYAEAVGRYAPALQQAKKANDVAILIDNILKEAVPTQVDMVATAMTEAWKSMAQMEDRIDRIAISPECEVRMLNAKGEDIQGIEKSAGANQIFTQALIMAITQVSGQDFPFIVDTPLARLSTEHRFGVLRTFLRRPGQVVLLSTDEEVVGDKLEAIRDRIGAAYQLRVRAADGVAVTTVESESIEETR